MKAGSGSPEAALRLGQRRRRARLREITGPGQYTMTPGSGGEDDVAMYAGERFVVVALSDPAEGFYCYTFAQAVGADDFDPEVDSPPIAMIDLDTGEEWRPIISVQWRRNQ